MGEFKRKGTQQRSDPWMQALCAVAVSNSALAHARGGHPGLHVQAQFRDHEVVVLMYNRGPRLAIHVAKGRAHFDAYLASGIPPEVSTTALVVPDQRVARLFCGVWGDGGLDGEDKLPPEHVAFVRDYALKHRAAMSDTRN